MARKINIKQGIRYLKHKMDTSPITERQFRRISAGPGKIAFEREVRKKFGKELETPQEREKFFKYSLEKMKDVPGRVNRSVMYEVRRPMNFWGVMKGLLGGGPPNTSGRTYSARETHPVMPMTHERDSVEKDAPHAFAPSSFVASKPVEPREERVATPMAHPSGHAAGEPQKSFSAQIAQQGNRGDASLSSQEFDERLGAIPPAVSEKQMERNGEVPNIVPLNIVSPEHEREVGEIITPGETPKLPERATEETRRVEHATSQVVQETKRRRPRTAWWAFIALTIILWIWEIAAFTRWWGWAGTFIGFVIGLFTLPAFPLLSVLQHEPVLAGIVLVLLLFDAWLLRKSWPEARAFLRVIFRSNDDDFNGPVRAR